MNKTINANIGNFIFHLDEEAYHKCYAYIQAIKNQFKNTEGGNEIIEDIELRIAEIFKEKLGQTREIVSMQDVTEMISTMGEPKDYLSSDEETNNSESDTSKNNSANSNTNETGPKRLMRDPDNRIVGGVCSGFGAYFGIDPIIIRVALILAVIFLGTGVLIYLIFWIAMPLAVSSADKLMMRGKAANINNIEQKVKQEWDATRKSFTGFTQSPAQKQMSNTILKYSKIVFGAIILLISSVSLVGFVISLVTSSNINFTDANVNGYSLHEAANFLFDNPTEKILAYIGSWFLLVVPCVLFIYVGVRLILGFKHRKRYVFLASFVLWIIGLVTCLYVASQMDDKFHKDASIEETMLINVSDSTTLIVNSYNNKLNDKDGLIIDNIDFTITKLEVDSIPVLEITKKSNGPTTEIANELTQKINYEYKIENGVIDLSRNILIPHGSKFRNQRVDLNLKIPVGQKVYLNENSERLFDDISNIKNIYDGDMGGHTWEMTRAGLVCLDCPADMGDDEYKEKDKKIKIKSKDGEIIINEDEVIINDKKNSEN